MNKHIAKTETVSADSSLASDFREAIAGEINKGAYEEALAICAQAIEAFPDTHEFYLERARCLSRDGELNKEEIIAWRILIKRFPTLAEPLWYQRLGIALVRREKSKWSKTDLRRLLKHKKALYSLALERWPEAADHSLLAASEGSRQAKQIREWVLKDHADLLLDLRELEAARALLQEHRALVTGTPAEISNFLAQFRVLKRLNTSESLADLRALIAEFLDRWPPTRQSEFSEKDESDREALKDLSALYYRIAKIWFSSGAEDEARELWSHLPKNSRQAHLVQNMSAFAQSKAAISTYLDFVDFNPDFSEQGAIIPWRNSVDTDKIVFVFSGIGGGMTMEVSTIHVVLRELGCHLVYLADLHRSFYLNGPTWESPEELCDQLKKIAGEFGAHRMFTLGHSAGGYGALRYGAALKAEAILAFSPTTAPIKFGGMRYKNKFRQMERKMPGLLVDLDAYYSKLGARPKAKITYGAESISDKKSAQVLAGFPEVTDAPVAGFSLHGVIRWYLANKTFETELRKLVDCEERPENQEAMASR